MNPTATLALLSALLLSVPIVEKRVMLAPFEDVGAIPTHLVSEVSLQEGLAGQLEGKSEMLVIKLAPEPRKAHGQYDLNTQLLPPSYRRGLGSHPTAPRSDTDWNEKTRREKATFLIKGTYEQYGSDLRISAEGIDPITAKTIFNCQVQGSTPERFHLESELAQQIADRIKPRLASPEPEPAAIPAEEEKMPEQATTVEEHYENGFALTRRFDQTGDQKLLEGAMDEYRAALAIDPNHFRSLNNLGTVLHRSGDHEEALRYYMRVLELSPKYARAMENAALAYKALGKNEEATAMWKRALECEDRPEVRAVIEETLKRMGEGGQEETSKGEGSPNG
jgi:tetratricopeptide (TPR) repeat protein